LIDLVDLLENSIWTSELEHALEVFSLSTYLNWLDYNLKANFKANGIQGVEDRWNDHLPEKFLHYLACLKVSKPCIQTKF